MKSYKYGYDLDKDLKELYGEGYSEISLKRLQLFEKHTGLAMRANRLNSIIQNPVPISEEDYKEWLRESKETIDKLKKSLDEIDSFINTYHIERRGFK